MSKQTNRKPSLPPKRQTRASKKSADPDYSQHHNPQSIALHIGLDLNSSYSHINMHGEEEPGGDLWLKPPGV